MPCDDDGTVERGTRSLSLIRNHSTRRSLIDFTVGLSLHQNPQVDYVLTRFPSPFTGSTRNNGSFRYTGGIIFTFGTAQ